MRLRMTYKEDGSTVLFYASRLGMRMHLPSRTAGRPYKYGLCGRDLAFKTRPDGETEVDRERLCEKCLARAYKTRLVTMEEIE